MISGDFWPEPEGWSWNAWSHWLCGGAGAEPTHSTGPQQSNPPTQGLRIKPKPLFIKAHLPNSCQEGAIAS